MLTEHFRFLEIAQFVISFLGAIFGCLIVYKYLIDLKYASFDEADEPRRFVAWSNVRRECLVLFSQVGLFTVGVSYVYYPALTPSIVPIVQFRQSWLLVITTALTLKSFFLLRDRKRLVELLSK